MGEWGVCHSSPPALQEGGPQEEEEGCLSNCRISKKSAQSRETFQCRGIGLGPAETVLGLRSPGFKEALCACVLNYLCLSDEVSKRA